MLPTSTSILVQDQSQIGEARRQAVVVAQALGFDETDRGRVALLVTELATNLIRHAAGGQILLRSEMSGGRKCVEVISMDRGPGMNIDQCFRDGYSTGGTSGTGLGAIRRLCTVFDIFSTSPGGTVILCQFDEANGPSVTSTSRFEIGTINLPAPHEIACGDTWRIAESGIDLSVMVVDGLGHGPEAAKVADEAAKQFEQDSFCPLTIFFDRLHNQLRTTRGGAVAVARVDAESGRVGFMGVGNIGGVIRSTIAAENRGLSSHNGTVGVQMPKKQEFEYSLAENGLLILFSDGLQSRWTIEKYPGLMSRHSAIIAAVLYRDFYRGRDDVTVAVIRRLASSSKW